MLNRAGSNWKVLEPTEEKSGLAGLKLSDTTSLSLSAWARFRLSMARPGKTCGVGRKSLAACYSISALASLETFWRPIGDSSTEGMRGDWFVDWCTSWCLKYQTMSAFDNRKSIQGFVCQVPEHVIGSASFNLFEHGVSIWKKVLQLPIVLCQNHEKMIISQANRVKRVW